MAKPPRRRNRRPLLQRRKSRGRKSRLQKKRKKRKPAVAPPPAATVSTPAPQEPADDEEARSSPLVRKIAREHGVSLSQVSGTGLGGRITKQDITAFIEKGSQPAPGGADTAERSEAAPSSAPAAPPTPRPAPATYPGDLVPLTNMRKILA